MGVRFGMSVRFWLMVFFFFFFGVGADIGCSVCLSFFFFGSSG